MENRKILIKKIDPVLLFGHHDRHLRLIEDSFSIRVVLRDDLLILRGSDKDTHDAEKAIHEMIKLIQRNNSLNQDDIQAVIDIIRSGHKKIEMGEKTIPAGRIVFSGKKGVIRPKTSGQSRYINAIFQNDIVFAIGPAGTGKTYLAVAAALEKLRTNEFSRIILTRPAIEAGENLGFLPGDMMDKVDPYLRPLTDAIFTMLPGDQIQKYIERKIIEIVPLAFMRGRTLDHAFIILDEAQNTTAGQMKMFLTRMGHYSKAVITGDITQIDLISSVQSGLVQIQRVLSDIEGIEFVQLDRGDVVRHKLVKNIIHAYERYNDEKMRNGNGNDTGVLSPQDNQGRTPDGQ